MDEEKRRLTEAWKGSSFDELKTAEGLYKLKRYSGSLFFCHLALEKILKAVYINNKNTHPPYTHKLAKLAKEAKLDLSKEQLNSLNEIETFNVEARYDVIKDKLYKKATKEFTQKFLKITKNLVNNFSSII